jgi:hypothetical protein
MAVVVPSARDRCSSPDSDASFEGKFQTTTGFVAKMDAVEVFEFESPAVDGRLVLRQPSVSGAIGFKLYPAALFCCRLFESIALAQSGGDVSPLEIWSKLWSRAPALPTLPRLLTELVQIPIRGCKILEVGAGITALPSQVLARLGAHAIATVSFPHLISDVCVRLNNLRSEIVYLRA